MEYIRRPIPLDGLEGYSVDEIGMVYARDGVSKISKNINSRGYYKVSLYVTGVGKRTFSVHRLVALAFVPVKDPTGLDVDHIDNDKLNNNYKNLQWLTRSENIAKSFIQGRANPRKGNLSGKLTGLYLTHKARAILDTVENKSKFVSDLIVDSGSGTPIENTPLPEKPMVVNPAVADLIKNADLKPGSEVKYTGTLEAPDFTANEQECCQHPTRPCKHWQWDVQSGEGYKNILSGRFREAD